MGNRVSKSDKINPFSVKVQRVDGNCRNNPLRLRYTLMGFEKSYQVKILSNLQFCKNYKLLYET